MPISAEQLIASLASNVCPGCNQGKTMRMTLCRACFFKLPKDLRNALYQHIGEGYEDAFTDAMIFLDTPHPFFPPEDPA